MLHKRQVDIADTVNFGSNVTVVEPVNLYGCTIGDDSFIGHFVEILSDDVVGRRCRFQPMRLFAAWSLVITASSPTGPCP